MTDSQLPHQARIQSLQAHLDLICALLGEIERAQMLSSDPTEKRRYAEQIAEKKQQKSAFEQELRDLGVLDPRPTILPLPDNPYLGLAAFRAENQANFFGRERDAQELKKLVEHYHFVALIGASGSGKSSLLFAGLTPLLGDSWLVLDFRPKLRPFYQLSQSVIPARYDEGMAQDEAFTELPEKLEQQKIELGILLDAARNKHKKARLLLIADQFEELYTQTEASVRLAFVQCLLNAIEFANTHDAPLTILFSYRADFTGFAIASFGDLLNQEGKLFLDRMSQEELERAITEPALRAGVVLETGLLPRILEDVGQEAGRLPLLQFALRQLWEQQTNRCLTHQAYEAIGGIEQALATHANQALATFNKTEQQRIRQIFMQLVRFGEGTEDTRQVATQAHIADWELVKRLADQRLVTTGQDEDTQQQTVEVVHEALIRHWQPLQEWIQADRAFRLWQEGLRRDMQDNALLRDARLAVARDWLQQRELELPEAERDFIRVSIAQFEAEQAEKLRQRRLRTVLVIVFIGLSGLAAQKWGESEYNLSESQKNFTRSEENLTTLKRNNSLFLAMLAEKELSIGHTATAIRLTLEALPNYSESYPNGPFVEQAQDFLTRAINMQHQGIFEHDSNSIVEFSSDGEIILVASKTQVHLWSAVTGALIDVLQGHTGVITSASFNHSNSQVITTADDNTARLWDSETGKSLVIVEGHGEGIMSAEFSPDDSQIITTSDDNTVHLWDSKTGKSLVILVGHSESIRSASFSPDGTRIITISDDKTARLWDSKTGKSLAILVEHSDSIMTSVNFSPDGAKIITITDDKTARLWDSKTGKSLVILVGHSESIRSASFSPDGTRIITISDDKTAHLWDSKTGKSLVAFEGYAEGITSASFSPDGTKIITTSDDETARLWDSKTGKSSATLVGHSREIISADFSPDGTKIMTISYDRTARLWSNTGASLVTLQGHSEFIETASFSSDGTKIFTYSDDNTARVWDSTTGEPLTIIDMGDTPVPARISMGFSSDGTITLSGSPGKGYIGIGETEETNSPSTVSIDETKIVTISDNIIHVMDSKTGVILLSLKGHTDVLESVYSSLDSANIISVSHDKTYVWDSKTGKLLTAVFNSKDVMDKIELVSFSPDSTKVVTTSTNIAHVWDNKTGTLLFLLKEHTGGIESVSFSPDGTRIITASLDHIACVWDSKTGKYFTKLYGHRGFVSAASFNPDGTEIATASSVDRTIRIWLTFPTLEATVAYAKTLLTPRDTGEKGEEKLENFRLTCAERKRFFLEELERCKGIPH